MKMCEAFADLGHEVELVVPRRINNLKDNPFEYYGAKNNFKIVKLACLDTVQFGFFGFLIEWLSFAEFVFWHFLFRKKDIYFGRDYIALLYLSFLGRKTVWEAHTGEWNILIWFFSKFGKKIVAISNGLKDFYVSKGVLPQKIIVAHDGVDFEQFDIYINKEKVKEDLGIKSDLPVVLYIGALGLWKGVETLLEASAFIFGKAQVVIIGGEEKQIILLCKKYPGVLFLGPRPYRELPINQKIADILVIPNTAKDKISTSYTSPLKMFAHMASGVPIVVSDLPSIREVLNEDNSYFAEPDSPKSFADVIKKVLSDPARAQKSAKALDDARMHTWSMRASSIINSI